MKRFFAVFAVAALTATPAFAQEFSGARVGVELGAVDDDFAGTDEATYGINAGYDFDLGNTVVGVTGSYTGLFDDDNSDFRDLTLAARAGFKATPRTLVYGTLGYTNLDANGFSGSLDGVKVGLGVEQKFGNLYANIETRYGNYEADGELYQTVIGLGYRF
ncbi:outer membrane protein [Sphingobium sp. SCG-1]|uniref:outer membrane protein n=1 Tax=Sphingobium sp. SCG-1 TaxID=2072936 RepID=UPI00167002E7|nr:outer membrane beta-barrel protein [Sphingobium sp. SCG-1]